jgi:hypothetical protein
LGMGFRTADTLSVLFHHFFFNLLNLYLLDIYAPDRLG